MPGRYVGTVVGLARLEGKAVGSALGADVVGCSVGKAVGSNEGLAVVDG